MQKRRLQIPGRRELTLSVNSLAQVDLLNVRSWKGTGSYVMLKDPDKVQLPYEPITIGDVPEGFGLDEYGLIVYEDFAIKVKISSDQIRDNSIDSETESSNRLSPRPGDQPTIPASVPESSPLSPSLPP